MKVILDNIIFSLQKSGGISLYWNELLTGLYNNGIDIECVENSQAPKNIFRKESYALPIKVQKEKAGFIRRIFPVFYKCTVKRHLFHSSYYRLPLFKKKGVLTITTIHDLIPERFGGKGIKTKIITKQKYYSIKKADAVICVSQNTKKDLLNIYPQFSTKKIQVIYNGVDDVFSPGNENKKFSKEIENFIHQKPFCLFIGKRDKYKNFKFAVDFVNSIPDLHLIIIGGGALNAEERHVLNSNDQLKFTHIPFVSVENLKDLYNNAEFLIYPSDYEGFGIPIVEAQKSGCPFIAQSTSSIVELVTDSNLLMNKLTLEEAHRVYSYIQNNRLKIINDGIKNGERFSWRKCIKDHISFYNDIYSQAE